jgi:MFS family permease
MAGRKTQQMVKAKTRPPEAQKLFDEVEPGPLRRQWVSLLFLFTFLFFVAAGMAITKLVIEPIKQELGFSDVETGLMQGTAFGIAFGIAAVPMGIIADRWNRTRVLKAMSLIWIASILLFGLAHDFWLFVLAKICFGMVMAAVFPVSLSIISDLFPVEARVKATTIFSFGTLLGMSAATMIGGQVFSFLAEWEANVSTMPAGLAPWRWLLVGLSLLGVSAVVLVHFLREPERQNVHQHNGIVASFGELWDFRGLIFPLLGGVLFIGMVGQALSVWMTPIFVRDFGLEPGEFSRWLGPLYLLCGVLTMPAVNYLAAGARNWREGRWVLLPAFIAGLASIAGGLFGLAPSVSMMIALLGILVLAAEVSFVSINVAIGEHMPNELRGLTIGLAFVVYSSIASIAPPIVALVNQSIGEGVSLGFAYAVFALPCAVVSSICFSLARLPHGQKQAP